MTIQLIRAVYSMLRYHLKKQKKKQKLKVQNKRSSEYTLYEIKMKKRNQ